MMKENKNLNIKLGTNSKDDEFTLFQSLKNKFNGLQHGGVVIL